MRSTLSKRILVSWVLLSSGPLFAASFDCAKARHPAEILICTAPALSKLDGQMGDLYRKNLSELSPNAATLLKDGQRDWLIYWPSICANDKGKLDAKSEETLRCAKTEYTARIATLKSQKRTVENLLAFPVSHYRVLKSTAGIDFIKNAHHTDTRMTVDADAATPELKSLADALNKWLSPPADVTKAQGGEDETTSDTDIQVSFMDSASPLILSTSQSVFLMGHGAAHPLTTTSQSHFNLPSRRPLRPEDIFEGKAWEEGLAHQVETALRKKLQEGYTVEKFETLKAMVIQPEHWTFDKKGLRVSFNPYDVAPYVVGAPDVTVPWPTLSPWLNPAFSASLPKSTPPKKRGASSASLKGSE